MWWDIKSVSKNILNQSDLFLKSAYFYKIHERNTELSSSKKSDWLLIQFQILKGKQTIDESKFFFYFTTVWFHIIISWKYPSYTVMWLLRVGTWKPHKINNYKELPQCPQCTADLLWPLTFVRITCGKQTEQTTANSSAERTVEETPLNKDVPVKQGVCLLWRRLMHSEI